MTTVSLVDLPQGPLLIVQTKAVLWPGVKPVTADVGDAGLVTVPVPLTTVQVPVPNAGLLAAMWCYLRKPSDLLLLPQYLGHGKQ